MTHSRLVSDEPQLTFDDVLLVPGRSEQQSRADVSTAARLGGGSIKLGLPVMTAAMDTVTSRSMAEAMIASRAAVIHHRNQSVDRRIELLGACADHPEVQERRAINGVAVGQHVTSEQVEAYLEAGANLIALEVAHAYHARTLETVRRISETCQRHRALLMVGNLSTVDGALWLDGEVGDQVDLVKVSQGGGSCCTTRRKTGIGKPTLQAVLDLDAHADELSFQIVADGGLRCPGDVAKALGAGASTVMLGRMLGGTDEAPGEVIEQNGRRVKAYRGMASQEAKDDHDQDPSFIEGISTHIPYQGRARDVLKSIREGLQGAISSCGFEDLEDFRRGAQFQRLTLASQREGRPHALHALE